MSNITGNITITSNSGNTVDMFNNQIMFCGLQLVSVVGGSQTCILDYSRGSHTLVVVNCFMYASRNMIRLIPDTSQGDNPDCRLYLEGCQLAGSLTALTGTNLCTLSYGGLTINNNIITSASNQNLFVIDGTARIFLFTNNQCTQDNASATLASMISYNSSFKTLIFGNNAFLQSSGTSKTPVNSSGVNYILHVVNGLTGNSVSLIGNFFSCVGTSGNIIGYQTLSSTSGITYYSNNATSGGVSIEGSLGVSKFPLPTLA
jgi:hypothetical protein